MATALHNLSDHDPETIPNGEAMAFGIVVSEWNQHITGNLLKGAHQTLVKNGVKPENIQTEWVPGSFELPSGAQYLLEYTQVDAVICLGSVIRGETSHFDFVCQGASSGIKEVALVYKKPVIFGVLTDDTEQQAIDRSGGKHGNKGDEAAVTALKMVDLQQTLKVGQHKKITGFGR